MEEAKVTFYKLNSCGYYSYGRRVAPVFGTLADTLQHVATWAHGRSLGHTRTHGTGKGASQTLPAYLVNATRKDDAWLLTLWNEAANTEGKVVSIDGFAAVGDAEVSETEVEEGHIPGHATYFWFLPDQNLMATIRFQHPMAGVYELGKFVHGFLANCGPHVVYDEPEHVGQVKVVGYRLNKDAEMARVRPSFKAEIYKKHGPLDYVISRSEDIRKIKKKTALLLNHPPEKALWQKMLENIHLTRYKTVQQEVDIYYELDVNGLAQDEVREVAEQWVDEIDEDSDYGFSIKGEGAKTHWLGKAYAKDTLHLDLVRKNIELVDPDSLLSELNRYRGQLLGLL